MKPAIPDAASSSRPSPRAPGPRATRLAIALAAVTLALEWLGCSPPPSTATAPADAPAAVAWVGDRCIEEEAFLQAWSQRPQAKRDEVLAALVRDELLLAEIQRSGFGERPDIRDAWRSFLLQRFSDEQRRQIASRAEPTPDDLVAYHRDHPDRFQSPARTRVAILQVRPSSKSAAAPTSAPGEARLERIRQQALALPPEVEGFGSLAREVSDHRPSRFQGGDLGWLTAVQLRACLPDAVVEVVDGLPANAEVSSWIRTPQGCFLARVLERKPAAPMPLDSVLERVRFECSQANRDAAEEAILTTLRGSFAVRTNEPVLVRLTPPAAPLAVAPPPALPQH